MGNIYEYIIKTVLLIITLCISEKAKYSSDAKVVQGEIWTHENWKFLTRFCFKNHHGEFEYDLRYDETYKVQNIDLYYDTPEQWPKVYGKRVELTTCTEKESVLQVKKVICSISGTFSQISEINIPHSVDDQLISTLRRRTINSLI